MSKKPRTHSLCEKMPFITVIVSIIITMTFVGIGGSLGDTISSDVGYLGMCLFAVIAMLIFKLWFSPEFKGFVKPGGSAKDICIVMIPFVIHEIFILIEPVFLQRPFYFNSSFSALIMSLTAGFAEETMFRIIALAIVMRYVKKEKRFVLIIILAVIFGLSHVGNLMAGADSTMTVTQVIHATFMGFLLTGLYLGTGSVIFPIFAHCLHDFISFTTDPSLSEDGVIMQQYSTGQLVYEVVLAVIIGIVALYLLSKNKFTKANELWDEKWSKE